MEWRFEQESFGDGESGQACRQLHLQKSFFFKKKKQD